MSIETKQGSMASATLTFVIAELPSGAKGRRVEPYNYRDRRIVHAQK